MITVAPDQLQTSKWNGNINSQPNLSFMATFLSTGSSANIQKQQKIENYSFASCCDNLIIFINCNWVFTRWQWLFYIDTKYEIGYY